MPDYLVSCIITTKDRPEMVVQAVKSALDQSHRHIEIILIDDSEKNGNCEGALRLGGSIKYIKNERSRGACYSRNIGISESKGDFIAFLDDDDSWMTNKIELQLKKAVEYPLVSCDCILCYDDTPRKRYLQHPEFISFDEMLYLNYLGSCSFVLGQAAVVKSCRFEETREAAQDWDMWLAIMQKNKISQVYTVKEYLVNCSHGSHTRISNTAKLDRAYFSLYGKYIQEHTPLTTNLFIVFNFMKTDGSILLWGSREFIKYRLKNKGLIFFIKIMFKKLFGTIELF